MLTAVIFVATYAIVARGRAPLVPLDRTGAALTGAALMVLTGAIGPRQAWRAIDVPTIVLLASMMILVAHLRLAGGLAVFARWVAARITHPAWLVVALVLTAGSLSALFVNDTICLVFTPIVLEMTVARSLSPRPYLLALATASNIGSVATLTGNPQNMLIGSMSAISFRHFASVLGPVAGLGLLVDALLIWVMFRREFSRCGPAPVPLPPAGVDAALLWKTLVVTTAALAGFLAGWRVDIVAAIAAVLLVAAGGARLREIWVAVDWPLLLLFAGLFVLVGAAERAGFDQRVFEWLRPVGVTTVAGLSATAAVLSNAISNVPAVMLLTKIVPRLPDPDRAWLVLAMSSTLAGNLTILGSIANLIVVEGAQRRGVHIGFWDYAKVGIPLSLATMVVGVLWLS